MHGTEGGICLDDFTPLRNGWAAVGRWPCAFIVALMPVQRDVVFRSDRADRCE